MNRRPIEIPYPDALYGPYARVDLLDGTTLIDGPWDVVMTPHGLPLAVTDGNTVVPFDNIRLLRRSDNS